MSERRNRAARKVLEDKPLLIFGSPTCAIYSIMDHIDHSRMTPEAVNARFAHASKQFEFAAKLYTIQIHEGRYLLHGHPEGASSWYERCTKEIFEMEGVNGRGGRPVLLWTKGKGRRQNGPGQDSHWIYDIFAMYCATVPTGCPNRRGYPRHKHVQLDGGTARAAQVRPPQLCQAVCRGLMEQIEVVRNGRFLLMNVDHGDKFRGKDFMNMAKKMQEKHRTIE